MSALKKLLEISLDQSSGMIAGLLAAMFFYAAVSKLSDFETSKQEMINQVFSRPVALQLVWLVPLIELIVCGLLLFSRTQLAGLYASFIMMSIFSLYISITMSGVLDEIPCSCGGILKNMGYGTHLVFNLFFLSVAFLGISVKEQWITI